MGGGGGKNEVAEGGGKKKNNIHEPNAIPGRAPSFSNQYNSDVFSQITFLSAVTKERPRATAVTKCCWQMAASPRLSGGGGETQGRVCIYVHLNLEKSNIHILFFPGSPLPTNCLFNSALSPGLAQPRASFHCFAQLPESSGGSRSSPGVQRSCSLQRLFAFLSVLISLLFLLCNILSIFSPLPEYYSRSISFLGSYFMLHLAVVF